MKLAGLKIRVGKWRAGGQNAGVIHISVNSMSFIWNDNMREKREANANAT
jgi:hypothetical protein